jgi:hypothetical protein
MFNVEKLEVWQEAIDFTDKVYTLTRTFKLSGLRKSLLKSP